MNKMNKMKEDNFFCGLFMQNIVDSLHTFRATMQFLTRFTAQSTCLWIAVNRRSIYFIMGMNLRI